MRKTPVMVALFALVIASCGDDEPGEPGNKRSCDGKPHGSTEQRLAYKTSSVPLGTTCESETQSRTCNDGTWNSWSGSFEFAECTPGGSQECDPGQIAPRDEEQITCEGLDLLLPEVTECTDELVYRVEVILANPVVLGPSVGVEEVNRRLNECVFTGPSSTDRKFRLSFQTVAAQGVCASHARRRPTHGHLRSWPSWAFNPGVVAADIWSARCGQ